jgi:hypothetical protein
MQTLDTLEFPRKFAGFLIVMELESVLQREPYAPFCRHFSVGQIGSSVSMRIVTGEKS